MDTIQPQNAHSAKPNNGGIFFGIEIISAGLLVLVFILVILNYYNIISLSTVFPKQFGFLPHRPYASNSLGLGSTDQNAVIAKVGEESLYQQDLNTELASYPHGDSSETRNLLQQKITKDSIILQEGQKEGLVQLDGTVFNSPNKDYKKRITLVSQLKNAIKNRQNNISGSVVSIWFFNDKAGDVGYDTGKEIAYDTIAHLYAQVKSKQITIQEAAQQIKKESILAQVDKQYATNALFTFKAGPSDKISFDPMFDDMIRKLQPGELTQIYLAKDKNLSTGKMIDAVYMFAQMSAKQSSGHPENFEQWYAQVQKNYAVTLY
jgi:hypothetical protein